MISFWNRIPDTRRAIILAILLAAVAYGPWVSRYQNPPNLFWDENYHVASAQKYLNRIFFMEPHPPLGKLLIAFGEALLNSNPDDTAFVGVDHAKTLPAGFSFEGYRFFPVVMAWLCVPLFFSLLYVISGRVSGSFLVALIYAFDNAMIVHMRGAMLEGMQMFFILGALFTLALARKQERSDSGKLFGIITASVFFSAAVATKVTALVIGLAFIPVLLPLVRQPRQLFRHMLSAAAAFFLLQYIVWQTHFLLARKVVPTLNTQGYYLASDEYKEILANNTQGSPLSFYVMFRDSVRFFNRYESGVPILNLCKPSETGSVPYLWPFGARSISYRWDSSNGLTSHIYLQINPVVWLLALIGISLTTVLIFYQLLFSPARTVQVNFVSGAEHWIYAFFAMWVTYMGIMISVDRVMYLYHYFVPLMFSLVLLLLIVPRVALPQRLQNSSDFRLLVSLLTVVGTITSFYFFAPLTYGWPISDDQLKSRGWLSIWDLRCSNCALTNHIARPWKDPKDKAIPRMFIGELATRDGMQEWGEPVQNATVDHMPLVVNGVTYQSGLGVHARSELRFPLEKRYFSLKGKVGLPDYLRTKSGQPASVVFEILLDGNKVWGSQKMLPTDPVLSFELPVVQADMLELRVLDGGDGIENDHALWLDLELK